MWQYQRKEMWRKRKQKRNWNTSVYRDTANVEHEVRVHTSNNYSHGESNRRVKEEFGIHTRVTFNRFITNDSCTWNIIHKTDSTAVWNLKPEQWGSPLVQEKKHQGENACDKRKRTTTTTTTTNNNNNNNNINNNTQVVKFITLFYFRLRIKASETKWASVKRVHHKANS